MRIIQDISGEVPDTNAHYWNLKEFSEEDDHSVLMYGYNSAFNEAQHTQYQDYKRKIYFNNWAPCEFAQNGVNGFNAIQYDHWFNEIYSICPYTAKWLNDKKLGRIYKTIFYPFHKNLIPEDCKKQYDVIYHGGIHGQEQLDCLRIMSNFNYRYCTMTHHINQRTIQCLPWATNADLSFQDKIKLVSQSKISVCYNLVHINPEHIPAIKSCNKWKENEAFSTVDGWNVMPQFKTRMHEAAISKTLNLVMRDEWNIVEKYYKPDEEFIYFSNASDLQYKIKEIVNNWEAYKIVVENAYNKVMNYTTDKFVDQIREDV